jgi:transposase
LDLSQKMTAICVVDNAGRRLRVQCPSVPEAIRGAVPRRSGDGACIGIETGAMTPWLMLKMQINNTDQNDAEGLAQIVLTGWYRSVHVKSFENHRARAILGARTQLVLSNHIRGVPKTSATNIILAGTE